MKRCEVMLKSVSPYSQGRYHNTEKLEKENNNDYEKRTWRNRLHVNDEGFVFIPPLAFKNCLRECAKYISKQIPGKGKSTYTKHFTAGLMVMDPLVLDVKKDEVEGEEILCPIDGVPGGSKKVLKTFPYIPKWRGLVTFYILDETITEEVFQYHLEQAGKFIGLGRFRPIRGGFYGRFDIEGKIKFIDM